MLGFRGRKTICADPAFLEFGLDRHVSQICPVGLPANISNNFEISVAKNLYFYETRNMKMNLTDDLDLTRAATGFAALGSEQRLGVLRALVRAGPEGLTIGQLGERCGVTGSTLTHHVKFLAQAGLVQQKRKGRSIICAAIAYEKVRDLSEFLLNECCADSAVPCEDHDNG